MIFDKKSVVMHWSRNLPSQRNSSLCQHFNVNQVTIECMSSRAHSAFTYLKTIIEYLRSGDRNGGGVTVSKSVFLATAALRIHGKWRMIIMDTTCVFGTVQYLRLWFSWVSTGSLLIKEVYRPSSECLSSRARLTVQELRMRLNYAKANNNILIISAHVDFRVRLRSELSCLERVPLKMALKAGTT